MEDKRKNEEIKEINNARDLTDQLKQEFEHLQNMLEVIEYGFATNLDDTKRLLYEWPILAESVVKAVTNYYKIPYSKPNYIIHIVKPNESLYSISKKYNIPIDEIKKKNNLTSDIIYPKTELII